MNAPAKPKVKDPGRVLYDEQRHTGRTTELLCAHCGALINPGRTSGCLSEADVATHAMLRHAMTTVDVLWADTAHHMQPEMFQSHRLLINAGEHRSPGEWIMERCDDPWCVRPAGDHPNDDEIAAAAYRVTVLEETAEELPSDPVQMVQTRETDEEWAARLAEARSVIQQRRRRAIELADAHLVAAGGHWHLPLVRTEGRLDPLGVRRVTIRFDASGSRAA